jgi:HlyD family secretion protein
MTMKKYLILFGCMGAAGLTVATLVRSNHSETYPRLTTASPRSFDITVNAIGVLDAARSHMVSSTIRGDRGKIIYLISDGVQVNRNDVLARLDPAPFEEEVSRFESEVHALEAAVAANEQMLEWEKSQVEREIRTAEYNLEVAELDLKRLRRGEGPLKLAILKSEMTKIEEDYKRYLAYISDLEELAEKGFSNPREIASAREKCAELKENNATAEKNYLSYQDHVLPSLIKAGEAKVKQAEMELGQLKKGGVFRIAKAKSAYDEVFGKLQTVKSLLANARRELEITVIRAPSSGIAIHFEAYREGSKRKPREGDRVIQNQPLLYLPDISSMIVKTQVREIDLHKIVIGQRCRVQVDAYPDSVFDGEISFVGALASENFRLGRGEKYFELTVALKDNDDRLRPGMTARVSILSDSVQKRLAIPVQAVFEEGGLKFCYKYLEKRYKKVGVTTGRQNEDLVVILSGLNAGDRVSLTKPDMD